METYGNYDPNRNKKQSERIKKQKMILMKGFYVICGVNLLIKKGTYPYEYMNCVEKFNDTELPKHKDFYSNISGKSTSETEYKVAQHIWAHFNIKTMGEYHDLYLQLDVLLLADDKLVWNITN